MESILVSSATLKTQKEHAYRANITNYSIQGLMDQILKFEVWDNKTDRKPTNKAHSRRTVVLSLDYQLPQVVSISAISPIYTRWCTSIGRAGQLFGPNLLSV